MLCRARPRHHRRHRRGDLGGPRRKGERDVDGLNAWVGDMTGDESFDALGLGEGAGAGGLADGIEAAFAERWDARREAMGEEAFGDLCRRALLRKLDQHWVDHLVYMDHLKEGSLRRPPADHAAARGRGGVRADEVVPGEGNPFREENLSYSKSGESTIQDDSDLPAMADIAGEVDIEADD